MLGVGRRTTGLPDCVPPTAGGPGGGVAGGGGAPGGPAGRRAAGGGRAGASAPAGRARLLSGRLRRGPGRGCHGRRRERRRLARLLARFLRVAVLSTGGVLLRGLL